MLAMALTAVSDVQVGELSAAPLIAADAMQPSATRLHDRGGTKRSLINPKTTLADVGRAVTLLVPVTAVMWSLVVNMNPLVTRHKQREQFESALKTLEEKTMLQTPSSRLALPIESTMASYTFSF